MLDPIVESIENRLLVFDFFPYGVWNVAHGRVRAAARTQHTGVPMPEMRSVPVHRRIGFLNDLFYGRSHIAGPGEMSIPFQVMKNPPLYRSARPGEGSEGVVKGSLSHPSSTQSELRRRFALSPQRTSSDEDRLIDRFVTRSGYGRADTIKSK